MRNLLNIIYSFLFYPLILATFHLWALFKSDVRKALKERYQYKANIRQGLKTIKNKEKIVLIHASSMGEFEHIKPLITEIHSQYQAEIIVTFFSPSGYENVKEYPGVKFFLYLPFDFQKVWRKVYKLIKPGLLIIAKHDVWPNQVWAAEKTKVPAYLINASLSEKSSRINPAVRFFQKYIYRSLNGIYTISDEDAQRFQKNFPKCTIKVMGDTKFDQVLLRKNQTQQKNILDKAWVEDNLILLLGSIWPEDARHIFLAVGNLLNTKTDIKAVIVPHQPEQYFVNSIMEKFGQKNTILFSNIKQLTTENVIVVDKIGILADLYKYAQIAYVGGSFRQGIHNVMEPAVYSVPVLYGPEHKNSYEAIMLQQAEGGIVINNNTEMETALKKLTQDKKFREESGRKAGIFAQKHVGGTERLLKEWRRQNII